MKTLNQHQVQPIEFLQKMIDNGGPEVHEYPAFNQVENLLANDIKARNLTPVNIQVLQNGFSQECLSTPALI